MATATYSVPIPFLLVPSSFHCMYPCGNDPWNLGFAIRRTQERNDIPGIVTEMAAGGKVTLDVGGEERFDPSSPWCPDAGVTSESLEERQELAAGVEPATRYGESRPGTQPEDHAVYTLTLMACRKGIR